MGETIQPWVGRRLRRQEDRRLVSGGGRYLDDLGHDALAAAFVRSPHAHARILDIDLAAALDVEGLVAIYTYEDLEGEMALPLPELLPNPALRHPRTAYALAAEVVRHVGEPVVMVVAVDRYTAEDVCDRIEVSYEPLPTVVGIEQARAASHLVHPDVPGNEAGGKQQGTGDVDAQMAAAPHRLRLKFHIERSASMPLETRGAYAHWDPDGARLTLHSPTQGPAALRNSVAARLGLDVTQVQVLAPDTGGGFGMRLINPWPEEVLVPWAARRLHRDVKFVEDRHEHFVASAHERAQEHRVEVGFNDEGRILAFDDEFWHDTGAYSPYGVVVAQNTANHLVGPYKLPHHRVRFHCLFTNTVMVTPYRGAGRGQGCFVIERTMDAIAQELGLDRLAVRRANFVQPDEMPYDHGAVLGKAHLVYDSGDYPAMLEKLERLVDWEATTADVARRRAAGEHVGLGVACYVEATGVGPFEGAKVSVGTDGEVTVALGLSTQGQGHTTTIAQITADALSVRPEQVRVVTGNTDQQAVSNGTFASRTMVMAGSAVTAAADRVRQKALRIAASQLEANPDDLELVDGAVRVKGTPTAAVELGQLALMASPTRLAYNQASLATTQFPPGGGPKAAMDGERVGLWDEAVYTPPGPAIASGVHAAVVSLDTETAELRIERYCVVHDCGTVINPTIVEGQVHGGVAQGVAGAWYERLAYDEHGQLQNASFMDFLMPYASEVPARIELDHLETPSPWNPLGVKGAGEAGVIPAVAALASAIEDAEGFSIRRMPLSPSDLYELRGMHRSTTEENS